MTITIKPGTLRGALTPPPSKSLAHRALIAAALADGESQISGVAPSQDILATARCLRALGAELEWMGDRARVRGAERSRDGLPRLDCRESGSTLRFLIPVALILSGGGRFCGAERLFQRPLGPYEQIFREKGLEFRRERTGLTVSGTLTPGRFALPGDLSSQFVTGLLLALPRLPGDSELVLTTPLESAGYVELTLATLRRFGVEIDRRPGSFHIPGGQRFRPARLEVEPDWSQAAFFLAANALGSEISLQGLDPESAQGDAAALELSRSLSGHGDLELNGAQWPDLVPALAVQAALRAGQVTCFVYIGRLRMKESDRLAAIARELNALGAQVTPGEDSLVIRGVDALHGGQVSAHNDHRIAMMLAVAATRADGPVVLTGAESVAKSYPGFWADYAALGGIWEEL